MSKQHFTTQVANLINPPLLSRYEKLQQEMLEKIYASKKTPLGRTQSPNVPLKAIKQGFGIITEKGDSAAALLYPINCSIFHSEYNKSFKPPNQVSISKGPSAGVKMEGIDKRGMQMKKVFEETGNIEPTVIAPLTSLQKRNMKNKVMDGPNFSSIGTGKDLTTSNEAKTTLNSGNLLLALWNLGSNKKSCYRKHFYSYFKSYLQNFSKIFTIYDLQKMFENFDMSVSKHSLKQVLGAFDVLDSCEDINYNKFLKALKWEFISNETSKVQNSRSLCKTKNVVPPYDITFEQCKTISSHVDQKSSVPLKTAGLPSCRSDIKKPELRSVADYNEYGDIKSVANTVQPSVFEKYEVYEDDLGALMSKEEIKFILIKSGLYLDNEVFNVVWEKVSKKDKSNIGEIWSTLKHLCQIKNSLYP